MARALALESKGLNSNLALTLASHVDLEKALYLPSLNFHICSPKPTTLDC